MPLPMFRPNKNESWEPTYDKITVRAWKFKKLWLSMNKDLINTLITDKYFGIYTRNGFDYIMKEEIYEDSKFYLLDFDNVKKMNKDLGYMEVNKIFKNLFAELKDQYIIGRAFSGDEIFFHTYFTDDMIDNITKVCKKHGVTFRYIEDFLKVGDNIEEKLEKMIENFH